MPFAQVLFVIWNLWRTRQQWDILHVHPASWWGFMPAVVGVIANWWGKRLVMSYHGGSIAKFFAGWTWLVRPVLRCYDAILALTPTHAAVFAQYGFSAQIVPNIVPIETFSFRPRGPVEPNILWLRQLVERYRPEDALQIFAAVKKVHPDATLTMAGGGSMTAQVTKEIADRGLAGVTLTGHLPDDDIPLAYDAADIFLNTSASDNQPQTLIEASASGLPVVSSDAGGIPDLIDDGVNGLLAPIGDTKALTDAILRLLDDPELAQNLSNAAHQNAQRFAWSQVAPQLAKAYAIVILAS
jgi:phenylacetate-CoA ligase